MLFLELYIKYNLKTKVKIKMLQCHVKSIDLGMGFHNTQELYDLALLKSKTAVIPLRNNESITKITNEMINELKNHLNPMLNKYSKKAYYGNDLEPDDWKNQITKFLILNELGHPDINLQYFSDEDNFFNNIDSISKKCQNKNCNNKGIKRCSGCGWPKYCSTECQKINSSKHKSKCFKKGK
jgi:hypothetical protein